MIPSARLIAITTPYRADDLGIKEPLDLVEFAGRWDYGTKSIEKMGDRGVIERWLAAGEESMVEMIDATVFITCSRVVSHELVRHRLASYQQESQRFVAYEDESLEDLFYVPDEVKGHLATNMVVREAFYHAQKAYKLLRLNRVPKQIARYILPNGTRTRIIIKANAREWRHILRLRLHKSAQPEMRQIMSLILPQLQEVYGKVLFPDDIAAERSAR